MNTKQTNKLQINKFLKTLGFTMYMVAYDYQNRNHKIKIC